MKKLTDKEKFEIRKNTYSKPDKPCSRCKHFICTFGECLLLNPHKNPEVFFQVSGNGTCDMWEERPK